MTSIDKWGSNLSLIGRRKEIEEVDLIATMRQFTEQVEAVLDKIVNKELSRRQFKKEHFEWLKLRYDYVQQERIKSNNMLLRNHYSYMNN